MQYRFYFFFYRGRILNNINIFGEQIFVDGLVAKVIPLLAKSLDQILAFTPRLSHRWSKKLSGAIVVSINFLL